MDWSGGASPSFGDAILQQKTFVHPYEQDFLKVQPFVLFTPVNATMKARSEHLGKVLAADPGKGRGGVESRTECSCVRHSWLRRAFDRLRP